MYYVGVDVGGTSSTVAVGNTTCEVLHLSDQFPTLSSEGPDATIESIVEQIRLSLRELGISFNQVREVGLSTPGPATLDGVILCTPNFPSKQWNGFGLRRELEVQLRRHEPSVDVHYLGDGQAAAMGEYAVRAGYAVWTGVASDRERELASSLFMATVGTGLGGGEIRDGRPVRGREGRAGHAGHIFLPSYAFRYEHDRLCRVGNAMSTLESAVSLSGLAHQLDFRLSLECWKQHPLKAAQGTVKSKAKQLRELAGAGDPLALQLFHDQARALGIGMLSINYLGDYDLLVIGGGVCDLSPSVKENYLTVANQAYQEFALDGFKNFSGFEFSVCGDNAPVIGALVHAFQYVRDRDVTAPAAERGTDMSRKATSNSM